MSKKNKQKTEKTLGENASFTPVEEPLEESEDRSAFNCLPCKGTGLNGDPTIPATKLCDDCHGTGRVE